MAAAAVALSVVVGCGSGDAENSADLPSTLPTSTMARPQTAADFAAAATYVRVALGPCVANDGIPEAACALAIQTADKKLAAISDAAAARGWPTVVDVVTDIGVATSGILNACGTDPQSTDCQRTRNTLRLSDINIQFAVTRAYCATPEEKRGPPGDIRCT